MKSWVVLGALFAVAVVVGLATQADTVDVNAPASLDSGGPRGTKILGLWLEHSGAQVRRSTEAFHDIPAEVKSVVIVAPTAEEISKDEIEALRSFVERGGTLVYLAPLNGQVFMSNWLSVHPRRTTHGAQEDSQPHPDDADGLSTDVTLRAGLTASTKRLRIGRNASLSVDDESAVPLTDAESLWWLKIGAGEVWLGTADLAENARLDQDDNALFWSALAARGPMLFDEWHHSTHVPVVLPPAVRGLIAQVLLCVVVALVMVGRRLTPAREQPTKRHRSITEYIDALAQLTESADVEAEVISEMKANLRAAIARELGVRADLSDDELARGLAERTRIAPSRTMVGFQSKRVVEVAAVLAEVESAIEGRT